MIPARVWIEKMSHSKRSLYDFVICIQRETLECAARKVESTERAPVRPKSAIAIRAMKPQLLSRTGK